VLTLLLQMYVINYIYTTIW